MKTVFPPPGGAPTSQKFVPARGQIFGIKNLAIIDWPKAAITSRIFYPPLPWRLENDSPLRGDPISIKLVLPRTRDFDQEILAIIDWPKAVRGAISKAKFNPEIPFPPLQ